VLSGGERTRLAVARMLLRPANTLLLDEPTNHLDMDSKDVLLDALTDFGGTLILVSHDRYFIDRLATKIIEIGGGHARIYPGTYEEFRWSKAQAAQAQAAQAAAKPAAPRAAAPKPAAPKAGASTPAKPAASATAAVPAKPAAPAARDERKAIEAEERRRRRATEALQSKIEALEQQIAACEQSIRDLESTMAAPGFYDNRDTSQPVIDRHQGLMWEVGDLMHQWEELQTSLATSQSN
jgi:ATP-binding cassette subfamily F protein 3